MVDRRTVRAAAPRGPLVTIAVSAISLVVGVAFGFAIHKRPLPAAQATEGAEVEREDSQNRNDGSRRATSRLIEPAQATSRAPSAGAEEAARVRAEEEHKATTVIRAISSSLLTRAAVLKDLNVEGQGHQMTPFLMGVMQGLRTADPALLTKMGQALADRTCDHPQSDLELIMVSQMIMVAPELSVSRTFDCGLRGRKTEDVPLWNMIDAWRSSGQPMPRAIAEIQEKATDERTTRRLSNYEQSLAERRAALQVAEEQPPATTPSTKPPLSESDMKPQQPQTKEMSQ